MSRRLLALLCTAALILALLVVVATAVTDVTFLSLDDTLFPLTAEYMPIEAGGSIYVPSTAFHSSSTGINLGVYFGSSKAKGTVTLYSRDKTLVFDIDKAYAYDLFDQTYPYRALVRNGRTYLPIASVCSFFGLGYSNLSTDYGGLIRVKTERVVLDDRTFVRHAATAMALQRESYYQGPLPSAPPSPSPSPTQPSKPVPTPAAPSPTGTNRSHIRVYLAIRVDGGLRLEEMLDALDRYDVPALFFFRPEEIGAYDSLVRRMVGTGHQVGWLVTGESAEALSQQMEAGNRTLSQIVRQSSYFTLLEGGDDARTALSQLGWLCWVENVDGQARGRSASALSAAVLAGADSKRSFARITMDDVGTGPSALPAILRELRADAYDLRPLLETSF